MDTGAFNHRYFVALAQARGVNVCDYGCGVGGLVAVGLKAGLDIWGADTFSGHFESWRGELPQGLSERVVEIIDGRADFPDASFDVVISNQVLEHVDSPESVIADMARLLRPGGVLMAAFPVADTWFEGHVGLYAAHWFPPGRIRTLYLATARRLGLGLYDSHLSPLEWARAACATLDTACRYYSLDRIHAALSSVGAVLDISDDYMKTRFGSRVSYLPRIVLRAIYHKRAGQIFLVTKR